jgi:hypothetical protein
MKYRDTFDGLTVENYLDSTASKLALIKNFREEVFGLFSEQLPEQVRGSLICHLKDISGNLDQQCKQLYHLPNLPMNPTALKQ